VVLAKIAETLCLMAGVMGVLRRRAQEEEIKANQLPNQVVPAQEETIQVEERATLGMAAALEEILGMAAALEETLRIEVALEETLRIEAALQETLRIEAALEETLRMEATLEETLRIEAALEKTLRMEATLEVKDSLRSVAAESALSSEEIIQAPAFLWLDMRILQAIQ